MRIIEFINVETRPVKWIYDNSTSNSLFVDNSFQRKFVWLEKHQINLIETILIGFPIPEVYLWERDTDPNTGNMRYSIIDGQQRIKSILKFLSGELKLKKAFVKNKNASYVGKSFAELSDKYKSLFWKYSLSIRFVEERVKRTEIIEMFLRLNSSNMTLNPQELRNAKFEGQFIELAGEISEFTFWDEYGIFGIRDVRRMIDIQFISTILIFLRKGITEETKQSNLNKVYDLYNEVYKEYDDDKNIFIEILSETEKILKKSGQDVLAFVKKKTQLYTLLITIYSLTSKKEFLETKHIANYQKFVKAYNNPDSVSSIYSLVDINKTTKIKDEINEYKVLSSKGTQGKKNRMDRYKLLKKYIIR